MRYKSYTAIEFGVANGAGLMNMAEIAGRVTKATGVDIKLVGFDSGSGMPPPLDYRDHPDIYRQGDFPMQDYEQLRCKLPANSQLIIGDISKLLVHFFRHYSRIALLDMLLLTSITTPVLLNVSKFFLAPQIFIYRRC